MALVHTQTRRSHRQESDTELQSLLGRLSYALSTEASEPQAVWRLERTLHRHGEHRPPASRAGHRAAVLASAWRTAFPSSSRNAIAVAATAHDLLQVLRRTSQAPWSTFRPVFSLHAARRLRPHCARKRAGHPAQSRSRDVRVGQPRQAASVVGLLAAWVPTLLELLPGRLPEWNRFFMTW